MPGSRIAAQSAKRPAGMSGVGGPLLDSELGAVLSSGMAFILRHYPTFAVYKYEQTPVQNPNRVRIVSPSGYQIIGQIFDRNGTRNPGWIAIKPGRGGLLDLEKPECLSAVIAQVNRLEANPNQYQLFNGCQHLQAERAAGTAKAKGIVTRKGRHLSAGEHSE